MTPKEKAIELVDKFKVPQYLIVANNLDDAKQCALIWVEESLLLIKEILHPTNSLMVNRRLKRKVDFIVSVKDEIIKL